MARIRTIKPQFWLDENLGAISRDARLLYIGLWNLADDTGVFKWRPLQIKAQIFPYDSDVNGEDVEEWLNKLVGTGDIEQIEAQGKIYGRIKSFLEHQEIKNPSKWTFLGNGSKTLPQPYPSPTPALPVGKRSREKEKVKVIGKKNIEESFELFWQAYPRKKSKGQAEKAFAKVNPDEQLLATMLATIERATKSEDWLKDEGKYIPHPATWLNARGWEDEIQDKGGGNGAHKRQPEQGRRNPITVIRS